VDQAGSLLIKATPPRLLLTSVARQRLASSNSGFRDKPITLLTAPAGFGKTSLLSQWRRDFLAEGEAVGWLSLDEIDEPQRFVQGLVLAFRIGSARPRFGQAMVEGGQGRGIENVTSWLAEVAQMSVKTVLILDHADLLPAESKEVLAYLLRNLPSNLRVVLSCRSDKQLGIEDLVDYGQCAIIDGPDLQFRLNETAQILRDRFGGEIGADAAARLHELTEGWPLGVQLVLSIMGRDDDPASALAALERRGRQSHTRFLNALLNGIAPSDLDLLTRISILDMFNADLCNAVLGVADMAATLERVAMETPLLVAGERSDWFKLHSFVCTELRLRFAALPTGERNLLHRRASDWMAENGMIESAALHAFEAGENDRAYELAERSLYDALFVYGHYGTVQNLVSRLNAEQFAGRPRLLLAAAWCMAIGERHQEADGLVGRLLAQPDVDEALRCECALIDSGGAVFADDLDAFARIFDQWADKPVLNEPALLHVHANRSAFRALIDGDAPLARLRLKKVPDYGTGAAHTFLDGWSVFITALSYLWEGQVLRVEQLMLPKLAEIDDQLGRRHPLAAMMAAVVAAALWERDRPEAAETCLAGRLDVLERSGLPEAVLLGYRTLSRIAWARGAEHQSSELLGGLHAVGIARRLPRLCIASLAEQARLNSHYYRASTCLAASERIDALLAGPDIPEGDLGRRGIHVLADMARAFAAIAAQEWTLALQRLSLAENAAHRLLLGRMRIELMALRAFALRQCGADGSALLREAGELAKSFGLVRVFADVHPMLARWVAEQDSAPADPPQPVARAAPAAQPAGILTPKEREVLNLLGRNLSNKEIGLAMQVGEETIKWHVKNLLQKLDAATRKHAVMRARLLGFLPTES